MNLYGHHVDVKYNVLLLSYKFRDYLFWENNCCCNTLLESN